MASAKKTEPKANQAPRNPSVATWAAIIIALCSLVLTVYSGIEDRRYKRLSVRPEISVSFYFNKDGAGWVPSNVGLGPARIKWFTVEVDGNPKKNWREVASSVFDPNLSQNYIMSYLPPDTLIRAADSINKLFWVEDPKQAEILKRNVNRVNMRICYCSLYDECWETSFKTEGTIASLCKEPPPIIWHSYPY